MPSPRHVYPFEACFFAAGTAGFNNLCQRCATPPEFMVTQKVGRKNRVTAFCARHAAELTGEVVRHTEPLTSKLPAQLRPPAG